MRIIFIIGPFRGINAWEVERNVRRAEEIAFRVWKLGAAAICPHTNTRFFNQAIPDENVIAGYWEILDRCDAVLLVPGWEKSKGSKDEVKRAVDKGLPVFHYIAQVERWLRDDLDAEHMKAKDAKCEHDQKRAEAAVAKAYAGAKEKA